MANRPARRFTLATLLLVAFSPPIALAGVSAPSWLRFHGSHRTPLFGMQGAIDGTLSPDGERLYVVSVVSDRLHVFERDPTSGLLTLHEAEWDANMDAPVAVAAASNDRDLYVASIDSSNITHWRRRYLGIGSDSIGVDFVAAAPPPVPRSGLGGAAGVAISGDQTEVWAVGLGDTRLFVYPRAADGTLSTPTTYDFGIVGARDIDFDPGGTFAYVTDLPGDQLLVVEKTAGGPVLRQRLQQGVNGVQGLDGPYLVSIAPDGADLYVTEFNGSGVTHFTRAGSGLLSPGASTQGLLPFSSPFGIAITADGARVLVTDQIPGALHVFRRGAGGALTPLSVQQAAGPLASGLSGAAGILSRDDSIYSIALQGEAVTALRFDSGRNGVELAEVQENGSGVVSPDFLAPAADPGQLLAFGPIGGISSRGGPPQNSVSVLRRDPLSGGLTHLSTTPLGGTAINALTSLAVTADGRHFYFLAAYEDALVFVAANGPTITTQNLWLDGLAGVDGLDMPVSLVLSPDERHLYVASAGDLAIANFDRNPVTGQLTWGGMIATGPFATKLVVSPDGAHLYLGREGGQVEIFSRNAATGLLTSVATVQDGIGGFDGLHLPWAMAMSGDGRFLYVGSVSDSLDDPAMAVLSRNPATGLLAPAQHLDFGAGGAEPLALLVSPSGGRLWMSEIDRRSLVVFERNRGSGTVSWIGTERDSVTSGDPVLSRDGRFVYTSTSSSISTFAVEDVFGDGFESGDLSAWASP